MTHGARLDRPAGRGDRGERGHRSLHRPDVGRARGSRGVLYPWQGARRHPRGRPRRSSGYPPAAVVDYAASKAALAATAKALAREYAPDGVLVNTVLPGRTLTPIWDQAATEISASGGDPEAVMKERAADVPIRRFGQPGEIANTGRTIPEAPRSRLNEGAPCCPQPGLLPSGCSAGGAGPEGRRLSGPVAGR